jgi:hypothetical protein
LAGDVPRDRRGDQARGLGREFKVEVADRPADAGGGRRGDIQADFNHGLIVLPHDVARRLRLEDRVAVLQRRRQLEAELGTVVRRAAPESLCQCEAIRPQRDFRSREVGGSEGLRDELEHEGFLRGARGRARYGAWGRC